MTPVFQTKLPPQHRVGNCLAAVVASLLDKKIDEVPNFEVLGESLWKSVLSEWLHQQGFLIQPSRELLRYHTKHKPWPGSHDNSPYMMYGLVGGVPHVVVMANGRLVHDPTPRAAGLDEVKEVWVLRHRQEAATHGGLSVGELLRLDHIEYSTVPEIPDY